MAENTFCTQKIFVREDEVPGWPSHDDKSVENPKIFWHAENFEKTSKKVGPKNDPFFDQFLINF
jgi:hypothetical protein